MSSGRTASPLSQIVEAICKDWPRTESNLNPRVRLINRNGSARPWQSVRAELALAPIKIDAEAPQPQHVEPNHSFDSRNTRSQMLQINLYHYQFGDSHRSELEIGDIDSFLRLHDLSLPRASMAHGYFLGRRLWPTFGWSTIR